MSWPGEQHGGLTGGGVGGLQHGGGMQLQDGGGDGGVQHPPAWATPGAAVTISQRPTLAISAIKLIRLGIDAPLKTVRSVGQRRAGMSRNGAPRAWPAAFLQPLCGHSSHRDGRLKDERRWPI
jgi:hypothetical protein